MKLEVGEHLYVSRGLYTHHGIYIGHDQVVHYSGLANGLQSGPVSIISLTEFSSGQIVSVRRYKKTKYNSFEVVERVSSRLGERLYSAHSNNCEHFCCWAITGQHSSKQVEIIETVLGGVFPVVEVISHGVTSAKTVRTRDKEVIESSNKKLVASTAEKTAIAAASVVGVAASPIIAPIASVSYIAYKLYRKIKS